MAGARLQILVEPIHESSPGPPGAPVSENIPIHRGPRFLALEKFPGDLGVPMLRPHGMIDSHASASRADKCRSLRSSEHLFAHGREDRSQDFPRRMPGAFLLRLFRVFPHSLFFSATSSHADLARAGRNSESRVELEWSRTRPGGNFRCDRSAPGPGDAREPSR